MFILIWLLIPNHENVLLFNVFRTILIFFISGLKFNVNVCFKLSFPQVWYGMVLFKKQVISESGDFMTPLGHQYSPHLQICSNFP